MGKKEGKIFQYGRWFVQSEGPAEVVEYDCGGLLSVSEGHGDELVESPPDHLWLICGGVSAGLVLRRNQS